MRCICGRRGSHQGLRHEDRSGLLLPRRQGERRYRKIGVGLAATRQEARLWESRYNLKIGITAQLTSLEWKTCKYLLSDSVFVYTFAESAFPLIKFARAVAKSSIVIFVEVFLFLVLDNYIYDFVMEYFLDKLFYYNIQYFDYFDFGYLVANYNMD